MSKIDEAEKPRIPEESRPCKYEEDRSCKLQKLADETAKKRFSGKPITSDNLGHIRLSWSNEE